MKKFTDERDNGLFIRTHIYLLLGCLVPVVGNFIDPKIDPYIGVISLGIQDSVSAVIGKNFGRNKLPGRSKTVEGTVAGLLTGIGIQIYRNKSVFGVIAGGIIEAYTFEIDNLVVPVIAMLSDVI